MENKLIVPQDVYNRIEADALAWSENQYGHDDVNKDYLEGALHEAMIAQAEYVRLKAQPGPRWVKASEFKTTEPVYRPYRRKREDEEIEYDYGEIYVTEDSGDIFFDVDNENSYEPQISERWKDYEILDEQPAAGREKDAVAMMCWAFVNIREWDKDAGQVYLYDGSTFPASVLLEKFKQHTP